MNTFWPLEVLEEKNKELEAENKRLHQTLKNVRNALAFDDYRFALEQIEAALPADNK